MKPGPGWTGDPALHLIAVTTALLGAALAVGTHAWRSHTNSPVEHPSGCHACSFCSPETTAARDAFLLRSGSIEPDDAD
jgi:hypothetical protein